jgi:FKBP-type peptidyl-prolyl cis-trans isomerase FkpA
VTWRKALVIAVGSALISGSLFAIVEIQRWRSGQASGPGEVFSPDGLHWTDIKVGSGPRVFNGEVATIGYTIWLADGTRIDSTDDRKQPFTFVVGTGRVIKGLDEGLVGMRVGGTRRITMPSDLAYGATGERPPTGGGPAIPPNSALVMMVELLSVAPGPTPP